MMKKIFHKLHLWLGLASGLLVFIIAVTGALYAFKDEIQNSGSYHDVQKQEKAFLLPSQLQSIAEETLPGKTLHSIKYNGNKHAAEASFYGYNPTYYYIVYLDPYTGQVQKVKDMDKDFFRFIMQGHYYLWLPPQVGHPLVACATLVFFLVLLSGLIIWIPKNRNALKNRVWFRWKKGTKWPRINLDLHVVGGLYVSIFALIFSITGLVWGFQWFAQSYYKLAGGKKSLVYSDVSPYKHSTDSIRNTGNAVDRVWLLMLHEYPQAASIEVHPPHTDSTTIAANANQRDGKYWKTDYRYFDQHSLKEVPVSHIYGRYADAHVADKLFRMNYEIHTGAILGLPGKIFACLMSLCIASFPITGFILWWEKRVKKQKK
jgi:uncharacterized iron-regulated membrane protein